MATKYTHLSQHNQILKRPGQHIGSIKNAKQSVWVTETTWDGDKETITIVEQVVNNNPGLMHIFYEVLGNAQDNYFRSKGSQTPMKRINIDISLETGKVSIWNDGLWIPAIVHEWTADEEVIDDSPHYEAEIIFGKLNTSSNYDDAVNKRVGGGLHGVGVKLTNIYSEAFNVEAFDPENQLKYLGEWNDNMKTLVTSKVRPLRQKKGFTQVTYLADFARFGLTGYTEDHVSIMKKLCFDCAMITGLKVYFNEELIPVKTLAAYAECYTPGKKIEFKSDDSTVILCEKNNADLATTHLSWVNGIHTVRGGVHVEEWKRAIFKPLLTKLNEKFKGFKLTSKALEQYFLIFIKCELENPEFDGQTKGSLIGPKPSVNVPPSRISAICKWQFVQDLQEMIRLQGLKQLQKTDGKKSGPVYIASAVNANKAGTAKSLDCTLFITEGKSAKAFAEQGISTIKQGTDWYGVLPIRGALLNVRGASVERINKNEEVSNIKKILGLRHGVDYTDDDEFKALRYGKVCILTDADPDGNHIKGLIMNFFQFFFPSLLERKYLVTMRTPIVKATSNKKTFTFYYMRSFEEWAEKQTKHYTCKYYKGLGSSKDGEITDIFKNPQHVQYLDDSNSAETIDMLFSKKRAHDRKDWLSEYSPGEFKYPVENGVEMVPISDFFNNEMIDFCIYSIQRCIPSIVDGFKPSQRKALWVGLQVLNTSDCKVFQFAAKIVDLAKYHHGPVSMEETIIGMAQTFVGANNIALFSEDGQFGTRTAGGKDHSSSRYISTRLSKITRMIFRKEDDPILEYLIDEGAQVEPRFFVPIIPMLLVNGCLGVGTAYSTHIPAFNPIELVEWIREWLDNEADVDDFEFDDYIELQPWYRGFIGSTIQQGNRIVYSGLVNECGKDCYEITELPLGTWREDYEEHLATLQNGVNKQEKTGYDAMTVAELKELLTERELTTSGSKKALVSRLKDHDREAGTSAKGTGNSGQLIRKWEWHGTPCQIHFKVWTKPGVEITAQDPKMKLTSSECLTNMTAFTPTGNWKKYSALNEMMREFCKVRYAYYQKRRTFLIKILEKQLAEESAKAQFIQAVLDDPDLLKQTEADLHAFLQNEDYHKKDDSYNYLTNIPIKTFTVDKLQHLQSEIKKIRNEIKNIKKLSSKEMWLTELDEFLTAYALF